MDTLDEDVKHFLEKGYLRSNSKLGCERSEKLSKLLEMAIRHCISDLSYTVAEGLDAGFDSIGIMMPVKDRVVRV